PAEHFPGKRRHRNGRACGVDGPGARIANIDGEDAGVLSRRRQRRERSRLPRLAEALEVGKEKCFVLDDRTAEHAAVLIATERWLLAVGRREESGRVQLGVAEKLPRVAMELIRT